MGKLPDPAAAVPLSDYRSEQLHAEELAHSKTPTHTHTRTNAETHPHTHTGTHTHRHATQHGIRRSPTTPKHRHADK